MAKLRLRDLKVRDFMSRDVVTGEPDEALSEVLGKMRANDIHEIPLVRAKKLVGVASMAAIARHRSATSSTKASTIMHSVPELAPDAELLAAAEKLLSTGNRTLPVLEKGRLVGILSRADVIRALSQSAEIAGMKVSEIMTPQPLCVSETDTIAQASATMAGLAERAIPVVDDHRRLVGVVGLKDLAEFFALPKRGERPGERAGSKDPIRVLVSSVMRAPITVKPETPLPRALQLMTENRISTILAEEKREPVGIVTTADLVELAARFREREGLLVQISGLEEESEVYDSMYGMIQKAMKRIENLVTPRVLNVHCVEYKAEGDNSKWSLRARFTTEHDMYYLKHFDWDLLTALDGLLDQLEGQIKKAKERRITERKRHHRS